MQLHLPCQALLGVLTDPSPLWKGAACMDWFHGCLEVMHRSVIYLLQPLGKRPLW